jgi:predicted metalloprotease with PDZ domain
MLRRPSSALRLRGCAIAVLLALCASAAPRAQSAVAYTLTFAERERKILQVAVTFTDVPAGPLQLRMSRSSPGRYALHEFAKNVFDVRATDAGGKPLPIAHPNPHQWDVSGHAGEVRVTYRVFGDQVDGTYLGINSNHAHINMPAAIMWARGFDQRPITIRFEPPPGASWRVATQLLTGRDALTFTAPNLQYLMDSPTELSAFALRTFTVPDEGRTPVFRVAVHHAGTDADLDAFVRDVETVVREARYVFGEYPAFEGNTYTFIADYLPGDVGDGMEHRNSTFLTSPRPLSAGRADHLGGVSHEFCHAWNVERIRPASLEPFNFDDVNMSGELWIAEGFCNYYGSLVLRRSGLMSVGDYARDIAAALSTVMTAPGRRVRSAIEMSRLAPFIDGARFADRTNFGDTYISYYTWGEALGVGLDLTLRDRSDGRVTLDDYMRALWAMFGRSAAQRSGYVASPYTNADLERTLAEVSGDATFAKEFFDRYVEGHDVVDYARLLSRAGLVFRPRATAAGKSSGDFEVVLSEDAGQPLTEAQRRFRDAWLSSGARNVF